MIVFAEVVTHGRRDKQAVRLLLKSVNEIKVPDLDSNILFKTRDILRNQYLEI